MKKNVKYFGIKNSLILFLILMIFYISSNLNFKVDFKNTKNFSFRNVKKIVNANSFNTTFKKIIPIEPKNFTSEEVIKAEIKKRNKAEKILNLDFFGPLNSNDIVVVVQVHKRFDYLKVVIESFSQAKEIENILLIFTHDIFNEEINKIVQEIKFCKVLQIFFPYSLQTHPHEFPGRDPLDCVGNVDKAKRNNTRCIF